MDIEPSLVRVEWGRQEKVVHEAFGVSSEGRQLGLLVSLTDDHQVETPLATVLKNGGTDDSAVPLAHATPPFLKLKVANSVAASPSVSGFRGLLNSAIWVAVASAGTSRS